MSVYSFLGPAGSGKTTRLMEKLSEILVERELLPGQRILALTRMHGSRLRLTERLQASSARGRFVCMTFDRLAWQLVCRWRSLLRDSLVTIPTEFAYDDICELAARLLHMRDVVTWLVSTFPIIVVDELQDCVNGRLAIVQELSCHTELLAAADDFQRLEDVTDCPATDWLSTSTQCERLATIYRTEKVGILTASAAIREGKSIKKGSCFSVLSAPNANVAAKYLATGIKWAGRKTVAIISATNPEKSRFVLDAMSRMREKPFVDAKTQEAIGPYVVDWEPSHQDLEGRLHALYEASLKGEQQAADTRTGPLVAAERALMRWLDQQRNLKGKVEFSAEEVNLAIQRSVQHVRGHFPSTRRRRALTIHQAKNQEFDVVLVLWPVQIKKSEELQRRLLYNAITRARQSVTVIVQDPNNDRMTKSSLFEPYVTKERQSEMTVQPEVKAAKMRRPNRSQESKRRATK